MVAENSCFRSRISAAALTSTPARTSTGCRFQLSNAFQAVSMACSTCAFVPLLNVPTTCSLWEGLTDSKVLRPVIRWPPITTGYSRPSSAFTVCRAVSIAALFSDLLKSVSGSFLNSLSFVVMEKLSFRRRGCSAVGMYSKTPLTATAVTGLLAMLLLASCRSLLPWQNEPIGQEGNLIFNLQNNLVILPSATLDGRQGRFLFGSAAPRTLIDPKFSRTAAHTLQLNEKESLRVASVDVDLHGLADAILGSDVWGSHAVTMDYRNGVLTYQKEKLHPVLISIYSFANEPMVNVTIDGRSVAVVI